MKPKPLSTLNHFTVPVSSTDASAGFVHLKAYSTHAAEHVDANDRRSGRYTELTETAGGGSHPLSSTGERRTRQPDPTLCPEHLLSSILFLWHYDYSNQFCLNDRRNSIVPINI